MAARVLRRKSKGSGGGLEPSATHASTALEQARPPSVIEIRGVARLGVAPVVAAHDAFGSLQSDAACGTRTRCGRSGWPPLSPPSRHPLPDRLTAGAAARRRLRVSQNRLAPDVNMRPSRPSGGAKSSTVEWASQKIVDLQSTFYSQALYLHLQVWRRALQPACAWQLRAQQVREFVLAVSPVLPAGCDFAKGHRRSR